MENSKSNDKVFLEMKNNSSSLFQRAWKILIQVGAVGLLVVLTIWYAMNTGMQIAKQYSPLVDASMEIKYELTTGHLWLEEVMSGDKHENIDVVWYHIDQAEWYAKAIYNGGENDKGIYIPLSDPELRNHISVVLKKINAFRSIAKERYANIQGSSIDSDIDQRFDKVFKDLISHTDVVETALLSIIKKDIQYFQLIQIMLILSAVILTSIIGLILYRYERRQHLNVATLNANNQQLKAGEQQLKANNQQLRAGEQQLKASNQQLIASEQQLKAANQQLMASEQQLRATNQQLKISQQKLALHVQQTPLAVIQWDLDFKVSEWNNAAEKIFGFTYDEAIGQHAAGLIVPESARKIVDEVWTDLLDQKGGTRSTNENNTKNNDTIICEWYNTPLIDEDGKTIGVASSVLDITERMQAEQNNRDLAKIIERSLNEIYIFDAETLNFVQVNYGACENIGYSLEELKEMTPVDIKPEYTEELFNNLVEPLKNGSKEIITFDTVHKRKDGSLYDVEVHLQLSEFLDRPAYIAIILDITETNRLQKLESRADRLEMAGTIAGQVAHDFNNLLGPIMAYPDLIRDELSHDHNARAYLDDIENAAVKIANINQDLLTMGRRGHYNQEVLNLNQIVLQAAKELELRSKTVICEKDLCEELLNISGGAAQLHRMFTNILVNAQDAMQNIGKISIRTENYYADDASIAFGRVPKGEYVKVTISDTGCGIADDVIGKIIDPFFSTKTTDKKRGSGLGLSVVDAVIKDHKGFLDLSSKIGHGTSFYLYFPIVRKDIRLNKSQDALVGSEKILLVDDDDIQRKVASILLKNLGYNVNTVESGEKAIVFLKENPQDLVILDMVMPGGIDGTETYKQIRKISPNQKTIILSGFSETDRVFQVQQLGAGAFIRKPITKKIISAAVRTELDR